MANTIMSYVLVIGKAKLIYNYYLCKTINNILNKPAYNVKFEVDKQHFLSLKG